MSKSIINSFRNELIEKENNKPIKTNPQNNEENYLNFQSAGVLDLIDENKEKIISFYSKYKYLCHKYGVENNRKNRIDILLKKVKIKIFKSIHEVLKYCLNINNIKRLPQNFIINIRIEFNRQYLEKTIEEIYLKFSILPSLENIINNNNILKDKKEIFIIFMKSKLKEIINIYLVSDLFVLHKKRMEKKSGINETILFDFVANNIVDYFLYGNTSTMEKIITEKDSFIINDELNLEDKNTI